MYVYIYIVRIDHNYYYDIISYFDGCKHQNHNELKFGFASEYGTIICH